MRLTTGKGAAAASRGTTAGATGTTPTCGAGGASTIGSSIGSSSRGTTSAVCGRYRLQARSCKSGTRRLSATFRASTS